MFSYSQVARWLAFPIDPITVEDWVANREVFGPEEKKPAEEEQLELAYQIETARAGKTEGDRKNLPLEVLLNGLEIGHVAEGKDYLVVAPVGPIKSKLKSAIEVGITLDSEKERKVNIPSGEVLVVPVSQKHQVKLRIKTAGNLKVNGRKEVLWSGSGKSQLIFDGRGRPLPDHAVGKEQQEFMEKLYKQLRD